ncbi:MAG: bifunctional pyr operon transcriptional regulator/uracil phosphoribosyltransferase PyrR [Deltaproteobacteria bacterium]|nr:bifunctional pyr operon transcriptional regulator/uracil phosphoribosyltransferase PyrR [Deltaproteobacteria bacterium]MBI2366644.1 bifunctional pyr operon transcriptional regulator/uracil phosphoribosyltransferase PyrR [Deltaproteobacteria bacterium]
MAQEKQILFERDELLRAVNRMAHEIVEQTASPSELVLIGIRSRGVHLARRLARKVEEIAKITPSVGVIDVTPYRDDRARELDSRAVGAFEIPVEVDEKTVVLIDDVIFRGRTIRAAMEAVARMGQAKRILVAALVDRGARELPIRADIVGKNIDAGAGRRVNVMLEESDGVDQITVSDW